MWVKRKERCEVRVRGVKLGGAVREQGWRKRGRGRKTQCRAKAMVLRCQEGGRLHGEALLARASIGKITKQDAFRFCFVEKRGFLVRSL